MRMEMAMAMAALYHSIYHRRHDAGNRKPGWRSSATILNSWVIILPCYIYP